MEKQISLIRIVFAFYPLKGGSITHVIEESKHTNQYLKKQIIIAPNFGDHCKNFDKAFQIPIYRINYPKFTILQMLKFPVVPLILFGYALNILKFLKINEKVNTILIVHGTLLGAIIVILIKLFNINMPIIIIQDSGNIFNISKRSALAGHLAFLFFKFKKPDCLIIIDDGNKTSEYVKKCINNKINYSVLNHAIDTTFFSPKLKNKDNEKFIILSTQRLDKFKRVDLGILAFKKFVELEKYPTNVKLIIVGDGTEKKMLEKMVIDNNLQNLVEFHGSKTINEMVDYLNNADIVIGTSLISNLNLSIQEAMACEKPVIVFDAGEINKLIKNFNNGIFVESNNIDEFAIMINKLFKNPSLREQIGQNARKTILYERNWEKRIQKELEIFNDILKKYYNT
ncbi:MAG: glycosyltransferase family 4 protein [Methanolinea sp.]|nr:glycosyltransferase family 4 protein [Methanolinea sp.]